MYLEVDRLKCRQKLKDKSRNALFVLLTYVFLLFFLINA